MAMDPQTIQEFNNELYDLNEAVNNANKAFGEILGPSAKKWKVAVKTDSESAVKDIDEATDDIKDATTEKEKLKKAQQERFKRELKRRGYDIDKNKVELNEIRDLNETQQKFLNELDKKQAKEKELIQALIAPGERFKSLAQSVTSLEGVFNKLQDKLFEATGKSVGSAVALTIGISALTGVAKAVSVMTDAIYKGERGASVGAKGFTEFAESVSAAIIGIGSALVILPFGKILKVVGAGIALLGAAAKGATKLVEMGAELNDRLYKSYNELSERGLTTAGGMTELYDSLHKVGLTSAEIEKFNKLLGENSKNLALFGGTAASGVKRFSVIANQIAGPTSKLSKEFLLMGINADAQREHIMKYMTEEDRLGLAQTLSEEQQIAGAKKYIENLDKLSMLTGTNRKELEEARATVMANENLRAAIFAAEQDKTEAGKARLAELKRFYEAAAMLQAAGDTKGATGIMEYAAGRGITGQASATAFIQFGGKGGLIDRAKKGGTSAELAEAAAAGYNRQMGIMADTRRFGGDTSGLMTGTFAQGQEFTARMAEVQKEAAKKDMSVAEYLDAEQEARKNTKDKTTQQNAEVAQQQQRTAMILDGAAKKMDGAGLAVSSSMKVFTEATDLFGKAVGLKKPETAPATGASPDVKKADEKVQKAKTEREEAEKKAVELTKQAKETNDKEARIAAAKAQREAEIARRKEETERANAARTRGVTGTGRQAAPVGTETTESKERQTPDNLLAFGDKSGSKSNFDALHDSIKSRVISAAQSFNSITGNKIKINSAKRDPEDQQRVWDESVRAGRPGISPTGMPIAKPGSSKHERGLAIDIQNYNDKNAVAAMNKQGLFQTVPNDPVHFEMANTGAMFTGPTEGYFVQLHGKEFVGNEKQLESIKKLTSVVLEQQSKSVPTEFNQEVQYEDNDSEFIIEKFTNMLESKADELLEKIKFGNKVDTDLLNYSQG